MRRFPQTAELYTVKVTLNPFPNKPGFLHVCSTSLAKHWEKEKLLITSNFSFSHSVFYLFQECSAIFIKFENVLCKLSFWKSLNLSFRKRVRIFLTR